MANVKWNVGTESGILRKKVAKENHEELLVFGYACKLFRDDEKALYIDQGKQLIPWMGDNTLKIDRYDCRGALSELLQYEANREDYDTTRWLGLSESERRIEVLCDEERYYSLKHNEDELELYKEEELKRLHQKGSEVQYNYDVPTDPDNSQELPEAAPEEDEPFVVPPELKVPEDMELPKTVKQNARIEKTAMFINKQGPQMEILIKTKQADNPQFSFMNKDDPLFVYYKHLLAAIKSGQYKVQSSEANEEQKLDDSSEQDGHEDYYLHPSLLATSLQSAPIPMPTVIYKPSADCSYFQLVNRIQGTQSESATPPPPQPPPDVSQTQATYEQQQQYYQQYYYAAQYYEYCKQMAHQFQGQPQDKVPQEGVVFAQAPAQVYPASQGLSNPTQFTAQNFMQNQAAYMQYMQQHQQSATNNPYAQIVSNLSHNKDLPAAYPNFVQPEPNPVAIQNSDITKAPILYSHDKQPLASMQNIPSQSIVAQPEITAMPIPQAPSTAPLPEATPKLPEPALAIIKKPLLSLAQYGSDSENENESEDEQAVVVKVPPGETRQIIDKMASYVLKNGKDFENIVKSKGDPRFEFLNDGHEYHPYYRLKTKEPILKVPSSNENGENKEVKEQLNGNANKPKEKKIITPVSFSIKKPKDEVPKEIKSALPVEESDDDQEDDPVVNNVPAPVAALPVIINTVPATNFSSTLVTVSSLATSATPKQRPISQTPPPKDICTAPMSALDVDLERVLENNKDVKEENINKLSDSEQKTNKTVDADELILEMIDLTDDLEERRETKRAENRKKDKIAAAARDKVALQLERKKKAAAFLKLKSGETTKGDTHKSDSKTESTSKRNSDRSKSDSNHKSGKYSSSKKLKSSKVKERNDEEVLKVDDSESEEGEIKKHKKSSKKKKSHKRKRSRSRQESKSHHKSKEHKKSKKRRKRSESCSSHSSASSL